MKKTTKDYTLLALAIPFFIALVASGAFSGCNFKSNADRHYASDISNIQPAHQCSDNTHLECDGNCECDGMECPVNGRDYQIDIHMDTVRIFDGQRLVGSYISTWANQMDTILLNDNQ